MAGTRRKRRPVNTELLVALFVAMACTVFFAAVRLATGLGAYAIPGAFRRTRTHQSKNGIANRLHRLNTTIIKLKIQKPWGTFLTGVPQGFCIFFDKYHLRLSE
ncbi:hypothetical protein [[Clostridium] hylemonae]|uniref:hypothetical protein n=1 Tax=[Clostridium] hylemonae TaxID=89153 RepID=UPI001FCB163C|nr:hypothetical protein [[Clostridium] hylemonae]